MATVFTAIVLLITVGMAFSNGALAFAATVTLLGVVAVVADEINKTEAEDMKENSSNYIAIQKKMR